MKRLSVLLLTLCLICFGNVWADSSLEFIENQGQWGNWFAFQALTSGGMVYLENDGLRYVLCDPQNSTKIDSFHVGLLRQAPLMRFHVYKMSFEGASVPVISGANKQENYYNYFLGNDPARWKSGIHPCENVLYKGLYSGVDLQAGADNGMLVYDFNVAPKADPGQIRLRFDGPESIFLRDGNLVINTSVGQIMEMKPYAYQVMDGQRTQVKCNYVLENNVLTFSLPSGYDHSRMLVIDPTVVFCSFTGSTADNWGFTATYDSHGDFYAGGLVNALMAGTSFPVSPGAYQSVYGGGQGSSAIEYAADIAIMKFNAGGTSRLYGTYLGGSNNERPFSMIADSADNLVLCGRTHSIDYPVTTGAYQITNHGGWDMVVSKLSVNGTALLASTYMGGSGDDGINYDSTEVGYGHLKLNYGDDARSEIQTDLQGNIYVTGSTFSTDFPTTATAIATTLGGMQDGVVFKFNDSLTTLLWSTYLHGSGDDAGYSLAFNNSQTSLYVSGGTNSTDFPVTTGGWQPTFMGDSADGFILKFQNSDPYTVQEGTYVGTANYDQVYGIQVDAADNLYVMGQSLGGAFPVTSGVYANSGSSQFVMKLDSNLSTDLASTVYGSGDPLHTNISPVAFMVDTCGSIYISGWGGNLTLASTRSGLCTGMPVTPDAYQSTTDGADFYFIVLAPEMTSLLYATFYGRNTGTTYWEGEHVDGGTSRFDKNGVIYQAICANCGGPTSIPFPTTAGSWDTVDGSINCNEAALKIAFNISVCPTAVASVKSGASAFRIFPDPANDDLNIAWNGQTEGTVKVEITDITGRTIFTAETEARNGACSLRVADWANGLYFVSLRAGSLMYNGKVEVLR